MYDLHCTCRVHVIEAFTLQVDFGHFYHRILVFCYVFKPSIYLFSLFLFFLVGFYYQNYILIFFYFIYFACNLYVCMFVCVCVCVCVYGK